MDEAIAQDARRVAVVGTTGSGKSTFARRLAAIIGAKHVELDALYHGPNWTPAEPDVFRARVAEAIDCQSWVTDGNYTDAWPLVWAAADTVVWLDYGFPRIVWQLAGRTIKRYVRREELWNGNREPFWGHFLPTDKSLFYWAVKTHWRRRREFPDEFRQFPNLGVVRLRTPTASGAYLSAARQSRTAKVNDAVR